MVSVLCTAYNHEKYIAQTLQCIVDQQTDFAFELLVNDDASTDSTAAIIRSFEEKYPHIIRAFYQEKNLYSQGIDAYHHFLYIELSEFDHKDSQKTPNKSIKNKFST